MDDGLPKWMDRVRTIGNSVAPPVAEWVGRRILEAS
jgi:site-specific DNA-cytosine methylase